MQIFQFRFGFGCVGFTSVRLWLYSGPLRFGVGSVRVCFGSSLALIGFSSAEPQRTRTEPTRSPTEPKLSRSEPEDHPRKAKNTLKSKPKWQCPINLPLWEAGEENK